MKICFVGSHGVGKSSAALQYASELKRRHPDKSVTVLEENVRALKRALNGELNTPVFQRVCILDQIRTELLAEHTHDIVVCDRTSIDPLIYAQALGVEVPGDYVRIAISNIASFDKVIFVRPVDYAQSIADDGFRHTDLELRNIVDELFEDFLRINVIKHSELSTSDVYNKGTYEQI